MGAAWLDLTPDADVSLLLAAVRDAEPRPEPAPLDAWVVATPTGRRVELSAIDGYAELAHLVANVMQETGVVRRAVIALDHDEYGAEHIVLAPVGGLVRRVHHVFVYPRDEDTNEPYVEAEPTLTEVPPAELPEPSDDPGALVDGQASRTALARLFDVPVQRLEAAAAEAASAHEGLQIIGAPFEAWLGALDLPWIGESGAHRIELRS